MGLEVNRNAPEIIFVQKIPGFGNTVIKKSYLMCYKTSYITSQYSVKTPGDEFTLVQNRVCIKLKDGIFVSCIEYFGDVKLFSTIHFYRPSETYTMNVRKRFVVIEGGKD